MNRSFVSEADPYMADSELSLFSYEILGLVGREGAGPHDLLRMGTRGRMLAWAGESQYYTEPKRLAKLGYLAARKEPGKTRERTVYTLTEKGLDALHEYAATVRVRCPSRATHSLRLLICDLVGEDVTRRSMATLRDDLADIHARLDDAEESAAAPAPREVPADRRRLPAAPARPPRGARRRGRTGACHDTTGAISRPRPVAATGVAARSPTASLAMRPARARGSHRRSTREESNGRSGITRLRFA